jgi:hypothetical protein
VIVRRVRRFGEDLSATSPEVDFDVKPQTAVKGLALWVAAGVLTHVAIRIVDQWFDRKG